MAGTKPGQAPDPNGKLEERVCCDLKEGLCWSRAFGDDDGFGVGAPLGTTPGWISRCLKRSRVYGLIKRVGKAYKCHLSDLGRRVVLTGLKLREMVIIPTLAAAQNLA